LYKFEELIEEDTHSDLIKPIPIFVSPNTDIMYSAGCFSINKPNVIILGNIDGQVEVWDLHDQVNKYGFRTSLFDDAVVKLTLSDEGEENWLAGGDEKGITRIVKLPNFLSYSNDIEIEKKWLKEFIDNYDNKILD